MKKISIVLKVVLHNFFPLLGISFRLGMLYVTILATKQYHIFV